MKEHNETYYSLEELKRARDCYEGYQDGEEVYYFVGALRYACDEIERLKEQLNDEIDDELKQSEIMVKQQKEIEGLHSIIKEVREYIEQNEVSITTLYPGTGIMNTKDYVLEILDKVGENDVKDKR